MIVADEINQQIKNNKLSHCYLIISKKNKDGSVWFDNLAKALNIAPVDITMIDNCANIKIAEVRQLLSQIKLKPHSSDYKLVLLKNADNFKIDVANAMLKTLEEPPAKSIIVLLISSINNVIPTIASRCQIIRLRRLDVQNIQKIDSMEEEISSIRRMKIYERFNYAKQIVEAKDIENWVNSAINFFRADVGHSKTREILKDLLESQKLLNTNTNKQLIIENLLIKI